MAKRLLTPWDDGEDFVWPPMKKTWFETLNYDPKTGDFEYFVMNVETGKKIVVLSGNGRRYKQDERNRARRLTWRLVDALNACAA